MKSQRPPRKVKILGQPASSYVGSKIWSATSRHLCRNQALKLSYVQQPGMNREWMAILDEAPSWKAIRIRRLGTSRRKKRRFKSALKVKPGQAAFR
jgi:hypothetical protein